MHGPHTTYWLIRENARRMAEERARMRLAAAWRSGHSRTGLVALFLRQMADPIDATGEARRPR
jgi:hypothetical protein